MSWRPGMAVSDPAAIEDLYILLRTRLDPGVSVQDTQQVRPCKLDVRHPCLPTVLDGHPGIKTLRGGSKLVALFSRQDRSRTSMWWIRASCPQPFGLTPMALSKIAPGDFVAT